MLPLIDVRISAAVALAATLVGFLIGVLRSRGNSAPRRVAAERAPARGTQLLWIVGTLVAIFWPVGVFVAPNYAYHWPPIPDFSYSWALQVSGVALGIAGGLLYSRAARSMGAQMTPTIQFRDGDTLVESGPYRFIRHPIYLAVVTIALGQALLFLSLVAAVVSVLLVGLAVYRARLEEGLLVSPRALGSRYTAYMARTGAFFPRRHRAFPSSV